MNEYQNFLNNQDKCYVEWKIKDLKYVNSWDNCALDVYINMENNWNNYFFKDSENIIIENYSCLWASSNFPNYGLDWIKNYPKIWDNIYIYKDSKKIEWINDNILFLWKNNEVNNNISFCENQNDFLNIYDNINWLNSLQADNYKQNFYNNYFYENLYSSNIYEKEWKVLSISEKDSNIYFWQCWKLIEIEVYNLGETYNIKWLLRLEDEIKQNKTYEILWNKKSFNCSEISYTFLNKNEIPLVWDTINFSANKINNNIIKIENKIKCNLNLKIQEVHRKYERWDAMKVHLKVKTEEGTYNVKTTEWFYFWHSYTVLWREEYFSPKLLKWWWIDFFKPWIDFEYILDKDTWEILREWFDEKIDNCNVWEQKLSDFKFEWWLTNIEVIDLNMKKFREYKGIEELETTWKEKYEENNFVFWFNYNNFSGWLMISFFMLILFFVALIKNKYSKQKSIFA